MRIENHNNLTIDELLDHLKGRYPSAEIKKPFLSSRSIIIPVNNMKHIIRSKEAYFNTDFLLPVALSVSVLTVSIILFTLILSLIAGAFIFGGVAIWIVMALLITKGIYSSVKKEEFNVFTVM